MTKGKSIARSNRLQALVIAALACYAMALPDATRGQAVDLALVLVIDNSGSIDPSESALQFNGYAEAFSSTELVQEMTSGPHGAIAVSVLLFSDIVRSFGGWTIVDGPGSAAQFANLLRSAPYSSGGGTHIAQALEAAVMELASCPYPSSAATIDLSGDGPDNEGVVVNIANPLELLLAFTGLQTSQWNQEIQNNAYRLQRLRDSIAARGVSINCVAIQDPALQDYFDNYVVTGKGSFTMLASSFQSFRTVIKKKILREVRQGIKQSIQRTPNRPARVKKPQTERSMGRDNTDQGGDMKSSELDKNLEKTKAGGADMKQGSGQAIGEMVKSKPPDKVRKEAVVIIRDAETKLPLSEAQITLIGAGTDFQFHPNGSLPGQFVAEFDGAKGEATFLRVEARGYSPGQLRIDDREPARYEIELERLPIQFIL